MNDGYKLLDVTLILYLFLPRRKSTRLGISDHKLSPYVFRCTVFNFIPYYGFSFNFGAHEVMAVELKSRCLLIMIKY